MAKTKISTLAKDLNVALPTVIDFLQKKGINIDGSPNTRVEDDVVNLLVQEFKPDRDLKSKSEQLASERRSERNKSAVKDTAVKPVEIAEPADEPIQAPRVIGKIDLNSKGTPVIVTEQKPEPTPEPAPTTAPAPEPTPAPEPEPTPAPAPEPVAPKTEPAAVPVAQEPQPAATTPAPQPEPQPEPAPAAAAADTPADEPADADEPEVFTLPSKPVMATPKIIGTIDLNAINQNTRPKKKTKEERRNERSAAKAGALQPGPTGNAAQPADRKKRKRIGKDKIDIEKAGQQVEDRSRNNAGAKAQHAAGKNAAKPARRPITPEVSDEDVSKQVKENLARLTAKDKGLKKGAKWRKEKREANAEREREAAQAEQAESKVLKLTEFVTVNDLATMMNVPINNVIATCMSLGVMVSINQRLDAETINIVAEEFGFRTEYISADVADAIHQEEDAEEDLVPRPPIVTVMGHVDHGKTSLLDYIRNANVIAGEAGGITQHIGSYSVKLPDGRNITFLDTPGHEAFTAMRARGAKVTDICIIIVAADDNVMPQTVEAINHASAAGVPIVFAINKIDKPHANPDKIKEELAGMNYLVEDWGGKYQSQDISAKKGIGVNELMEKVLLEAEMLDLRANPNRNAVGTIIESSLDKGRGYVANVLVQNGTLRVGDIVLAGNHFGRIKAMFNERNQRIQAAGPATPALILGLNGAPTAGDTFNVLDTEQEAREIASRREQLQREQGLRTTKRVSLEDIARRKAIGNFQELNIIVKGDVDGSIEALSDSLIKLSTEEVQVNVIHKAVGEISESDVTLAAASDAVIIGFQVRPSLAARRAAERDGVQIRLYSVIYQAIEEVKDAMAGLLAPEIKEDIVGTAEVLETYHISKVGTIAGAMVRDGKIKRSNKVRLIRDGIVRYTGDLGSLKRFKDDAKEVAAGFDCGLSIAGFNDIKVGDIVECYEEVEVSRTL